MIGMLFSEGVSRPTGERDVAGAVYMEEDEGTIYGKAGKSRVSTVN